MSILTLPGASAVVASASSRWPLFILLGIALLAGCQSKPQPRSTPLQGNPQRQRIEGMPNLNTDPCIINLQELCGPLIEYYFFNRRLPAKLDELKAMPSFSPSLSFHCPVSKQPYVYNPNGMKISDKQGWAILWDATAAHNGWRLGIAIMEPGQGPLVAKARAIPPNIFIQPLENE